jgi:hypothetical protein
MASHDARSIEAELLFASARRHPTQGDVSRAHAALSAGVPIDWVSFVPLAKRHGVLPLLYRHLSTDTFDARLVPSAAFARLREEAEKSARRSLMLTGELLSLLDAFEREGIRVVPLKGPILGEQLYGSAALRRTNDLDLLVEEADAERAVRLLVELDFRAEASWTSDALRARHRDINYHVELASRTKPYRVELHYCLHQQVGRRRHTLATIEDELESILLHGRRIPGMRPEFLLVYLCVHGSKHLWERIEWIGGVAELLRSGRIADWDRVNASVRRLSAERAFRSGLHVVQDLFDVPIPAAERRGDRSVRVTASVIATRLRRDPAAIPGATARLVHHVRLDGGIRDQGIRVWSTLFVATLSERAGMPLPRALSPVYYLVRPLRLVLRRVRRLASRGGRAIAGLRHPS